MLHCDAAGIDMYAAIDLLADKLDRLLMKHKRRSSTTIAAKASRAAASSAELHPPTAQSGSIVICRRCVSPGFVPDDSSDSHHAL